MASRIEQLPIKFRAPARKCMADIGALIQKRRKAMNMTQEELAEELGYDPDYIRQVEQSRVIPSIPRLFYICRSLNIKITIG